MYCPRCGSQPVSSELRFCSYCGFKLDVVKIYLGDPDQLPAAEGSDSPLKPTLAHFRDINMGVVLMFLGDLLTSAILIFSGFALNPGEALLILAASFISILLFARPLIRAMHRLLRSEDPPIGDVAACRKEVGFGATLMLIVTLLSALVLTLGEVRRIWPLWPIFFLVLLMPFVLLLLTSDRLMQIVRSLVTTGEIPPGVRRADIAHSLIPEVGVNSRGSALLPAQDMPVSGFYSQSVKTAEIVSPPSVTERTTDLLGNKRS